MGKKTNFARMAALMKSTTMIYAIVAGVFAGGLSVFLKFVDKKFADMDILTTYNPNKTVFNVFIIFCGLITATRTGHALVRYLDAAALMNKQSSCWHESIGTLVAFTRSSDAPKQEIRKFNEVGIRLFSLLSGLCLEGMENKVGGDYIQGHNLEVIGWHDLSPTLREAVSQATCKAEYVHQMLDNLVVDGMRNKIVTMAPPLMGKVFNELGAGLNLYHEAKKYSAVPLPFPYVVITRCILMTEAVFVPFILATLTAGYVSSFTFTFGGTFLLWFLNGVAENLDNPFKKEAYTLEVGDVQEELNEKLLQILKCCDAPTPCLCEEFVADSAGGFAAPKRESVTALKRSDTVDARNKDERSRRPASPLSDRERSNMTGDDDNCHDTVEVAEESDPGACCACTGGGGSPVKKGGRR